MLRPKPPSTELFSHLHEAQGQGDSTTNSARRACLGWSILSHIPFREQFDSNQNKQVAVLQNQSMCSYYKEGFPGHWLGSKQPDPELWSWLRLLRCPLQEAMNHNEAATNFGFVNTNTSRVIQSDSFTKLQHSPLSPGREGRK